MRRLLLVFLVATACGGKQKSTTPPPPLPEESKAQEKPAEPPKQAEKAPEEPPLPKGPVDVPVPSGTVTVKLIKAGSGKKVPLKLAPKAGDKQAIELAVDFSGKQTMPPELGGQTESQVNPTVIFNADVEAKEVGADGATKFEMTIKGVDAKDVAGAKNTGEEVKKEFGSLAGWTVLGAVNPNGSTSDLTIHIEKPDRATQSGLEILGISLMPIWPVFPTEPIGPGAKWTVTRTSKLMGKLDVTNTTDYELVSKKGKVWTLKGTTKVTGTDQEFGDEGKKAKFGGIAGTGSTEATYNDGALLPTAKHSTKTDFTATVDAPEAPSKTIALVFHLEQTNAVTPK
ncbi:MAG TPA: hypothetical protein VFV99_14055 [Kofleriaceae bacterium]|nr:hypothetical protein [Kofleriaceae bacterium]